MKTFLLTALIAILSISMNLLNGQSSCGTPNIYTSLLTQSDIDDFLTVTNPGCTEFLGHLAIIGSVSNSDPITDLSPLSTLESVDGYFDIRNCHYLNSSSGLTSLQSVGGSIWVYANSSLTNLDGFDALTTVGGRIWIFNNNGMISIDGFGNLSTVGNYLEIDANHQLTNVNGLSSLTYVGGDLKIDHNFALDEFCGIYGLIENNGIGGTYNVYQNLSNPTESDILADGPCSQTLLPVTYSKELTAKATDNGVRLSFSVAQQINNNQFEIEHSINGHHFINIGNIKGENNSKTEKHYSLDHIKPSHGLNYYRVKQVDLDGRFEYSKTVSLKYESSDFQIYPNPTNDNISVFGDFENNTAYHIYSMAGELILKGSIMEGKVYLTNLKSGFYIIEVNQLRERLVKI